MIKELIGAIGMTLIYNPQPINRANTITQTIQKATQTTNKGNVYTTNSYEGEDLIYSNEYATIDYEPINLPNIATIENRVRIETTRDIENEVYNITIDLITRITKQNITTNNQTYTFLLDIPNSTRVDLTSEETYYNMSRMNNLTQNQTEFINGKKFNSYEEISQYNLRNTSAINVINTTIEELGLITVNIGTYDYYQTSFCISYNGYQITDKGTSLLNNKTTLKAIWYTLNYTVNVNPSQYEVIDLPGFMFEILGMPFAWLSIAFNFTLFPGTPYAINVSHILLGLLVSLIAIIIFRLIMKGR